MGWLGIIKLCLSLASGLVNYLREQKLLDAGAKAEIGRQVVEITRRAGVADQVRAEIANMSDADLDAELRGDS